MIAISHPAAALAVACTALIGPGQPPVKVHGVLANGQAGYVELHNPSQAEVDLSGWSLASCSGSTKTVFLVFPSGFSLPPDEHLLIAGADFAGTSERRVVVPEISGEGQVLLDRHGTTVDRVGLSATSPCREAEAAEPCAPGLPLVRDERSTDTDYNRRDFTCAEAPA
ncbi:lamin tail domain-containing protein [Saccharothrix syringae]|uniref:Lamin tail domain-containing protein n=1 Tax=Saccharothrix syringae TaxID=103733 RepID=A0A5Q0H355_SACSY|nr:lamin tail domain-containing protein [Saccharothrix syringae]QFZ20240.1 lamin tail domain-containing protein [Saccharothrix syringae]